MSALLVPATPLRASAPAPVILSPGVAMWASPVVPAPVGPELRPVGGLLIPSGPGRRLEG